jgi:hypothetical protein
VSISNAARVVKTAAEASLWASSTTLLCRNGSDRPSVIVMTQQSKRYTHREASLQWSDDWIVRTSAAILDASINIHRNHPWTGSASVTLLKTPGMRFRSHRARLLGSHMVATLWRSTSVVAVKAPRLLRDPALASAAVLSIAAIRLSTTTALSYDAIPPVVWSLRTAVIESTTDNGGNNTLTLLLRTTRPVGAGATVRLEFSKGVTLLPPDRTRRNARTNNVDVVIGGDHAETFDDAETQRSSWASDCIVAACRPRQVGHTRR